MIEKTIWSMTAAGRNPGADVARDEPSHIHLPRRRRLVRRDDQDNGAPRDHEEHHGHAQPAIQEA